MTDQQPITNQDLAELAIALLRVQRQLDQFMREAQELSRAVHELQAEKA